MSLVGSILDLLPNYVPKSDIIIEEEHEFVVRDSGTPKTVYKVEKGPADRLRTVTATVSRITETLSVDEDVELRDTTGDGQLDSIAFINSDTHPDAGTKFTVEYVAEPIISRYTGSFDDDIKSIADKIDASIDGKYLDTAQGQELDRIGSQYGAIGRRLGRKDEEYRPFLRSIVDTFDATGTKSGIRFIASSVLEVDPSKVEIVEDFDNQEFSVRVKHPNTQVQTSSLNSLIDLVSPTGVGISAPPTLYTTHEISIRGKTPTVFDSDHQIGVTSKTPDVFGSNHQLGITGQSSVQTDLKTQLGLDLSGFNIIIESSGLGSSTINSDRTLGSNLTTMRNNAEIGITSDGSKITDSSEGLSSSTLDSGDTYE